MVPYESGARRITSNLGSDLFCPLWLVGLAHLEWRARVARSCCIGRRWSVGCSPLVLDRSSWSVVGSFLKFGRNSTCCQYGGGNVLPLPGSSLSQLFGVDHLSSRSPLHRLGEGQGRGGKRLPRAALLPHCDRCLTGASALDFGHPRLYLQSSVEKTGREAEKDGNFRLHVGALLLGPSGALCCSAGAFGDTSGKPTPQCVHMGSGTTTFQDLVRKGVRRCCGAAPCILCHHGAEMELLFASTLVTSSVTTKVSKSREGRRKSAHQRSLSRLETVPPRWASSASLSPVMGLDPQWWTSDGS